MLRIAALLVVILLSLAAASIAGAQSGPLITPGGEALVETDPPGDEEDKDGGLSTEMSVLLLVVALGLIGGTSWMILRDARSAAPSDRPSRQTTDADAGGPPTGRGNRSGRDKRRAKAKQARQQRKRNR